MVQLRKQILKFCNMRQVFKVIMELVLLISVMEYNNEQITRLPWKGASVKWKVLEAIVTAMMRGGNYSEVLDGVDYWQAEAESGETWSTEFSPLHIKLNEIAYQIFPWYADY